MRSFATAVHTKFSGCTCRAEGAAAGRAGTWRQQQLRHALDEDEDEEFEGSVLSSSDASSSRVVHVARRYSSLTDGITPLTEVWVEREEKGGRVSRGVNSACLALWQS